MIDSQLHDDIKYGTNIIPEDEYLETLTAIADVASDMVVKTLGPHGRTTMLHDGASTYPTKDGWSVLRSLKWNDPIFNVIYEVLRQVSFDLVSKVGDGTTTAFVGATIFIHKIRAYIDEQTNSGKGYRQSDFLNTLNEVVDQVIDELKNGPYVHHINPLGDFEDIYQIAKVASNGNEDLSRIIQKIYQETNNPNIYVTFDAGEKLRYDIQKGYKIDCHVLGHKYYRNNEEGTYGENSPMSIYIFDHNVNYQNHIAMINAITRQANAINRPAIIVAPHFDSVLSNIIMSSIESLRQQGQIPNILLVQIPLSMELHRAYMSDLVLLTNAQVIDYGKVSAFNALVHNLSGAEEKIEDALLNSEQYKDKTPTEILSMCCGTVVKMVAAEKYLLISEYERVVNKSLYEETMKDVEKKYLELKDKADKSTTPLLKEYMDAYQHYNKLVGNMGSILVGGLSQLEKKFVKDAVDDAVLACRSAYDNGYVRGLNLAMMNTLSHLFSLAEDGSEEKEIIKLLFDTFYDLSLKVLENKTPDGVYFDVKTESRGTDQMTNRRVLDTAIANEYGFDLVNDYLMKDESCYVVNSVKTDIEVLKGMISIVSTMLTSNQFLSINRNYDRAMGQRQREEMLLKRKHDEAEAIASAVMKVMEQKNFAISVGTI